jgi:hypothetical protein
MRVKNAFLSACPEESGRDLETEMAMEMVMEMEMEMELEMGLELELEYGEFVRPRVQVAALMPLGHTSPAKIRFGLIRLTASSQRDQNFGSQKSRGKQW